YAHDRYGSARLSELFDSNRRLFRRKARRLGRWLARGPRTRVVEVGSFVGGFLAAGLECGWTMVGVDPGEEVGEFCASHRLPVIHAILSDAELETDCADCVAIWNTFDQIARPEDTVSAARRILRPGGILAVRVANGDCFRAFMRSSRRMPRALRGWW